jgi:hypothetical protein
MVISGCVTPTADRSTRARAEIILRKLTLYVLAWNIVMVFLSRSTVTVTV